MSYNVRVAIIGGTGLYSLEGMELIEEIFPDTPWGKPSDKIKIGKYKGKLIAFLPRHGIGHFLSPPEVPNHANICALKQLGVEEIVAFSSVNLVTNYWTHFYAAFTSNCTGLTKSNDE